MSDPKEIKKEIKLPENIPTDWNFERMLKTFLKSVEKSGVLQEIRERRYYEKPSAKKRRLSKKGKRR
jgi:ribosomal protein S21